MKHFVILIFLILSSFFSFAQNQINNEIEPGNDFNKKEIFSPAFKLYPTENMWTFLKLNTRNGQIHQVQYDVQSNNRFEVFLNSERLVREENELNGRFELYPTQNQWNFILLDQIGGRVWQVQWSIEPENRFIIPIY